MLRPVALFRWKPKTTAEDVSKVADFTDQEGLFSYANHPDHQAVIQNQIRPILAQREAIPYVIDHSD